MNCPTCQSSDVARTAIIYAGGSITSSGSSTGTSNYIPGIGTHQITAYGESTATTALAQVCAPPTRWRLGQLGCLGVVVTVVLSFPVYMSMNWIGGHMGSSQQDWDGWAGPVSLIPGILLIPVWLIYYVWQRVRYHREMREWGAEWICLRCACRWIP